jgi:hypothetical protein
MFRIPGCLVHSFSACKEGLFSAPSAHNLEFLLDEKNLLIDDRRVAVECLFNP